MKYFPIFIHLAGEKVIVLGGGESAARKVRLLLKTSARISVFAGTLTAELAELTGRGRIEWRKTQPDAGDLEGARLLFVAGAPRAKARQAVKLAKGLNIPVNVVDDPEQCSFLTPSIVDRDPVTIAIGTEGTAPVLARSIKSKIEALLPPALGRLAKAAGSLRARVGEAIAAPAARRAFWQRFFTGAAARHFLAGETHAFEAAVEKALDSGRTRDEDETEIGAVALVGAGPGDPDLLTLKAQRCLQRADVIVYDRLVGPDILDYARRDAIRIAAGKTPGGPSVEQAEINRIMVREALAGKYVVRLKGGDPYVFGRGAEEQAVLEATGIPFEIVPGITAAAGCAASVKLPLTQRGTNSAITLLSAMTREGVAEHEWAELAKRGAAFAIYMGVRAAGHIAQSLLDAGIEPATPVVVVQDGTLKSERCVVATIGDLPDAVATHSIKSPAIIFVGLEPGDAVLSRREIEKFIPAGQATSVVPFPGQGKSSGGRP